VVCLTFWSDVQSHGNCTICWLNCAPRQPWVVLQSILSVSASVNVHWMKLTTLYRTTPYWVPSDKVGIPEGLQGTKETNDNCPCHVEGLFGTLGCWWLQWQLDHGRLDHRPFCKFWWPNSKFGIARSVANPFWYVPCCRWLGNTHLLSGPAICVSLDNTIKVAAKAIVVGTGGVHDRLLKGGILSGLSKRNLIIAWVCTTIQSSWDPFLTQ
jgi:hypothetical protein